MNDSSYWQRTIGARGLNRRAFLRSAAVSGAGTAAFLAGCRGRSSPSAPAAKAAGGPAAPAAGLFAVPEAKRGGTITVSGNDPTTGWDPHGTISFLTCTVTDPMGIKLVRHDFRKTPPWKSGYEELIIGELAEKWESPDPLTYNFTMRKGINWPNQEPMNGGPITSADVVYAFAHAALPTSAVQQYVFANIKSVTAVDDYTVQFKLNAPQWLFPNDLDSYNTLITPKGLYEWAGSDGLKSAEKTRGGGPWLLEDYKAGSVIKFKPNEAYRKVFGVPYADHINVAILSGGAPQLQAFIAKNIQFFSPSGGQLDVAKSSRPDAKSIIDVYAPAQTNTLSNKVTEKPFDDVRVRRAISMAIDRDGWGKALQAPYKWESGPITYGYPDWKLAPEKMPAEVTQWLKFDIAEAKKLLGAAGVSASTEHLVHMFPYDEGYTPQVQFLMDSLSKVGITTKLKVYEANNWAATANVGNYVGGGFRYGPANLDRISQQFLERYQIGSARNHWRVSDDASQQLLKDFWAAKGPAEAKVVSNQIQTRSVEQAWGVWRPQPVSPVMWDPAVQNYEGASGINYQTIYRGAFYWLA